LARTGRKANLEAKRRATTRAGRRPDAGPPLEVLLRRLEVAGVDTTYIRRAEDAKRLLERHRLFGISADHPIDMLHATGRLRDPAPPDYWTLHGSDRADLDEARDETALERRNAAVRYAWLHWRRYGRPFAGVIDLGTQSELNEEEIAELAAKRGRTDGWEDLDADARELWYAMALRWMEDALKRAEPERGGFVVRSTVLAVVIRCLPPLASQLPILRCGLDALARVRLPSPRDVPDPAALEAEARRNFRPNLGGNRT
jgi:hypothetical protein